MKENDSLNEEPFPRFPCVCVRFLGSRAGIGIGVGKGFFTISFTGRAWEGFREGALVWGLIGNLNGFSVSG